MRLRHSDMFMCALGLAFLPLATSVARANDLDVTADHVVPGSGTIRFILYRGADGFRHEDHAFRILSAAASATRASVHFKDLPVGDYAVMAYHDANNDRKLNLRFGMFPKEGWGLSNNPRVMGPPSYKASSLTLDRQNQSIIIDFHY